MEKDKMDGGALPNPEAMFDKPEKPDPDTLARKKAEADRLIVSAIAALPEEAFRFLCMQIVGTARTGGGFQPESRKALEKASAAVIARLELEG